MTFKIGYFAKRTGLISEADQTARLRDYGCDVTYGPDEGIDAAIQAIRGAGDLFVVYSTAVITRPAFPRVCAALSKAGVDLHSIEAGETFPTRDGEAMKRAWDGIAGAERRTGRKGGRPSKHSREKMQSLRDEGHNNSEIAKLVGCSPATVGRKLGDHK